MDGRTKAVGNKILTLIENKNHVDQKETKFIFQNQDRVL